MIVLYVTIDSLFLQLKNKAERKGGITGQRKVKVLCFGQLLTISDFAYGYEQALSKQLIPRRVCIS